MRYVVVPEGGQVSAWGAMCITAVLAGCGMTLVSTGSTVSHVSTLRSPKPKILLIDGAYNISFKRL